jgi:drug/metabolite transporter (DMT)-like permease
MKNKVLFSHLALFSANLIYAITFTVAKLVMPDYVPPIAFILLRVTGASLLFWTVHSLFVKEKVRKQDWKWLVLCGFFGVAFNQMLFFKGLNLTSPINAAVTMTSTPILVFLSAIYLRQERLNLRRGVGILLGAIGAISLISMSAVQVKAENPGLGNFFVFLNAASYSIYLVLAKPLMSRYNPITVIKWAFTFGFIFVLPFGLEGLLEVNWSSMKVEIIWAIVFVIICTSFLAYLFNILALKNLRASTVSFYIYLQPLLATIFALFIGSDSLDPIKVLSGMAIFVGVFLVSMRPRSESLVEK